jgi:bla regulator protein blaR1
MMITRNALFRPIEIGFLAVLGLAGAAPGRADNRAPPAAYDRAAAASAAPVAAGAPTTSAAPTAAPAIAAVRRDRDLNYVYLVDDNTTMSGDSRDVERARRLRRGKEPLVWFRSGGQDYVIREPGILQQIDAAMTPVRDLGNQQGELGKQQGELGKQQGELGARMSVIGTREGTLAVRESALAMRDQSDALTPAEKDKLARQRHELRQHERALRKEMRALERPMHQLGERMQVLGQQMQVLGQQMQVASARAEAELRALFQKAIASGTAKPAA